MSSGVSIIPPQRAVGGSIAKERRERLTERSLGARQHFNRAAVAPSLGCGDIEEILVTCGLFVVLLHTIVRSVQCTPDMGIVGYKQRVDPAVPRSFQNFRDVDRGSRPALSEDHF